MDGLCHPDSFFFCVCPFWRVHCLALTSSETVTGFAIWINFCTVAELPMMVLKKLVQISLHLTLQCLRSFLFFVCVVRSVPAASIRPIIDKLTTRKKEHHTEYKISFSRMSLQGRSADSMTCEQRNL